MRRQDVHDELRARLHEAAEAHEPDRARILARVERGMDEYATRLPVYEVSIGDYVLAGGEAAVLV
ncbi:hypothetical protein AB0A67_34025, partial [Streptomyces eurythermus]